jgi:hypothetical protein
LSKPVVATVLADIPSATFKIAAARSRRYGFFAVSRHCSSLALISSVNSTVRRFAMDRTRLSWCFYPISSKVILSHFTTIISEGPSEQHVP